MTGIIYNGRCQSSTMAAWCQNNRRPETEGIKDNGKWYDNQSGEFYRHSRAEDKAARDYTRQRTMVERALDEVVTEDIDRVRAPEQKVLARKAMDEGATNDTDWRGVLEGGAPYGCTLDKGMLEDGKLANGMADDGSTAKEGCLDRGYQ